MIKDKYGTELNKYDMVAFPRIYRGQVEVLWGMVVGWDIECLDITYQAPVRRVSYEETWKDEYKTITTYQLGERQDAKVLPRGVMKL